MAMRQKKAKEKRAKQAPLNIFPVNGDKDYMSIAIASSAGPSLIARCANEDRSRTLEQAVNNGLAEVQQLRDYVIYLPRKYGFGTEDEMVRFYKVFGILPEVKETFYRFFEEDKRIRRGMSEGKLGRLAMDMPPKLYEYFIRALHIPRLELQPKPARADRRVRLAKEALYKYARNKGYTGEKNYIEFYQGHGLIPSLQQKLLDLSEIDRKNKRITNGLLHQLFTVIPHELYNLIAVQAGVRTFGSKNRTEHWCIQQRNEKKYARR